MQRTTETAWDDAELRKLTRAIRAVTNAQLHPHDLRRLGLQASDGIVVRTLNGLGAGEQPFAPYSAKYAKYRQKKGRPLKVNLTFEGHMLANFAITTGENTALVQFASESARRKARYHASHEPRSKMPLRDFVGIEDNETLYQELTAAATQYFGDQVAAILAGELEG